MMTFLRITAAIVLELFAFFMTALVCILLGSFILITCLVTMTLCIQTLKLDTGMSIHVWKNIIETYYWNNLENNNNNAKKTAHPTPPYICCHAILTHMEEHNSISSSSNNNNQMTELEMCKTALCFKEHELFTLRNDVQTQQMILQTLTQSFERLERTLSAGMDRLARTVNRKRAEVDHHQNQDALPSYRNMNNTNNNKRRRGDRSS